MSTPNPDIPNIPNTPDVAMPLSFGPARPLVLFPVRLETRFFPLAGTGSSELRVRVYPDKVHIDTHEPELTADEVTWGQHFWEQTWRAGNDAEHAKAAWRQLADRFDPPRAAWIARTLRPLNPEDRPAKPPRFPSPAMKAEAWTRASCTRVLPSYWIMLGYKEGRLVVRVKGREIPDTLPTGPDPKADAVPTSVTAEHLAIDDGMQWMMDFDAAERVGMGMRAILPDVASLDFVLVLGVKDAPGGTTDLTPRLAELFDAHHYTDGLSFVLQGTPSNNTTDAPSGFRSTDSGHETSYLAECTAPAWQPGDGSNADVLTTAFGLAQAGPVFANLSNATATEQLDTRHMHTALWQATWGYFLLQMLGVGGTNESPLTDDDIPGRAASTVESIAGGETPPPELEVVQTPRTGIALTHRLVALFSGDPVVPPAWAQAALSIRANAEPHLNAWAAKLLVNPAKVRCLVERLDPTTGQVVETKELRFNQLRLAPLDCLYAVDGGDGGQQAELEQRILYGIMRKADGFAPGSLLRVHPGRKPDWQPDEVGYGEFRETLRAVRQLLANARGLDADDVTLPTHSANCSVDVAELEQRVVGAESWLRRTPNDFQQQLATPAMANLEALRALLWRSASCGVAGTVPLSVIGEAPADCQTLLTQAGAIHKELVQRVAQLTAFAAGFNASTATVESRRDYALARLRIIFGKAFVVLPRFTTANAAELGQALADSTKVQDGDPCAATTWFQRMARVRDGVAQLHDALSYAEALGSGEKLTLTIAQLPYAPDDRWVGLPLVAGQRLPGGKLSLVVQSTAPLDTTKPLAGVLIDEWVEVVPSATETTGIALQYDQPNAAPPQTILLAVPPEIDTPWTVWSLQQVLLETLDLARIRAVDSDTLDDVGHYLPALYFACNTAGDTVATDFTTIK